MQIANDTDFSEKVLEAEGFVLVDFWAEWCAPCRQLIPIFEETEEEFKDKVSFVKVNVDEAQDTAKAMELRSIPTLILFNNGNKVATNTGVCSKEYLATWIKQNIK